MLGTFTQLLRAYAFGVFRSLLVLISVATPGLAAQPGVIELGDSNDAPFTTAARDGFFDLVATEAFRRAGLELRVIKIPAERGLQLANRGLVDGELGRNAGLEKDFPNLILVPEKLIDRVYVAFSKDAKMPADVEALRVRPVGYIRGWKLFEKAMAGAPRAVVADDALHLFDLLQRDRVEVVLYARLMGYEQIRRRNIRDVHVLAPPFLTAAAFIYLHKNHAGLVPGVAAALRSMKQDGSYEEMYRRMILPYGGLVAR